ncbi:IST1-like protein [Senna tora]|uniref:IST1-like protein n=1 Tax=Senna tora TaxID=362788 RepID=A0A834TEV9_9FABA|nr:IST1-like protein [Senna tora]
MGESLDGDGSKETWRRLTSTTVYSVPSCGAAARGRVSAVFCSGVSYNLDVQVDSEAAYNADCKALIKLTKSRIDVIRRKRKATEKFLKKDIADLLANGLDINAYGRAEGLLVELTLSSCYDFVEQSCDFVLKHLSVMQKLSGCPEECREAVSSLMVAAARFSDLPELRDLRQIFQEKYGNSMECYVNQEFAGNVNSRSPTLENKVHLMQEIASEFSIMWDSKAFEQRMLRPSAIAQDHNIHKFNHFTGYGKPSHGENAATKEAVYDVLLQKSPDRPKDGRRFHNGKEADILTRDGYGKSSHGKNAATKEAMYDVLSQKSPDHPKDERKFHNGKEADILTRDDFGKPSHAVTKEAMYDVLSQKSHDHPKDGRKFHNGIEADILTRDGHNLQSKSKHPRNGFKQINSRDEVILEKHDHDNLLPGRKDLAAKKSDRSYRKEDCMLEPNEPGCSSQGKRAEQFEVGLHVKSNVSESPAVNHGGLPEFYNSERKVQKDETPRVKSYYNSAIPPPYVKPNSKQKNSTCDANKGSSHADGDGVPKHPSVYDQPHATNVSERSHLGLQNLFNDEKRGNDEEEKMIDRLLIHYSKKPSIPVPEKARRKSKSRHAHQMDERRGGPDETPEMVTLPLPPRSISLPREETGAEKVNKVFNRAASFQPDRSNEARHVHPKLPDYDDLAARIAALRGT